MFAKALFTFFVTLSASLGVMYLNAPTPRAAKHAVPPASDPWISGAQAPTCFATEDSEAHAAPRFTTIKPRCTKPCCR